MSNITDRTSKSRAALVFAKITQRDAQQRVTGVLVPGSEMKQYKVIIRRNGTLSVECLLVTGNGELGCQGNRKVVCYHCMAALIMASEHSGKRVSFCEDEQCAERLARTGGRVFEVHSSYSEARPVWMVVRDTNESKSTASAADTTNSSTSGPTSAGPAEGVVTYDAMPERLLDPKYTSDDWKLATQWADEASQAAHESWAERMNEYILDGTDDRPVAPPVRAATEFIEDAYQQRKSREYRAKLETLD